MDILALLVFAMIAVVAVVVLAAIVVGIVFLVRYLNRKSAGPQGTGQPPR